jgi:hypothetical protein
MSQGGRDGIALRGFQDSDWRCLQLDPLHLFLAPLHHAQGLPGIEAKLMLQAPGGILPSFRLMPSDKERPGNMLDLKIHLIHLCPHGETVVSLSRHAERCRCVIGQSV